MHIGAICEFSKGKTQHKVRTAGIKIDLYEEIRLFASYSFHSFDLVNWLRTI